MRKELTEKIGQLDSNLKILIKKLDVMTDDVPADCADSESHHGCIG